MILGDLSGPDGITTSYKREAGGSELGTEDGVMETGAGAG